MVYASREKDNKRLAIVVTTICCQKERENSSFVFFSFSSLFIFRLFILFLASIHHRISLLLLFLSFPYTVNQSLYTCLWPCTTIYWVTPLCYVLHSGRSFASPSFLFLFPSGVRLSPWNWTNKKKEKREQTNMKSIFCILDIHCLVLYFFETKKIIIRSVSRWEKYQIISFVISLSISFSHHSFIRRRNGVERLCAHPIIEENGWKRDTLREKERETVMEQWASRETTTISHFDPLVSLLLLVSFLRRQWCVCVYAYEQPDERNMRIVLRDLIHFTPSVYEKYFEATAWPISVYVYASIEHTAGLFNINRLFFSSFFLDHSLK